MPLVLGLASSHAPSMFCPADQWPRVHRMLSKEVPQPPELADETPAVLEEYVQRVQHGFGTLREQLEAARPDALVIVGDDQTEVFSKAFVPAIAVHLGEEASGTTSISWIGEKPEDNRVTLRNNPALARAMVERLMARGFDPAYVEELLPLGRPANGLGHAFTRLSRVLGTTDTGLPTIIVFLNAYHPPLPSAARCYALGRALGDFFADRPERVAVLASGGLSHCPMGPRAGWVDEPLDRWVLDRLADGEGARLQELFTFDSDTLRSGTGEIRSWITVAGAFDGVRATVIDYIPARHAVTGLGFAYWTPA
jgi:Catalytic LigB subunit of aromatic ring-opening dioxygenase